MRRRISVVDELVEAVSRDVLLGLIPPSTNLPPLRTLAKEHRVTVPTAQRAVARLEELGLIDIRHGSGMRVRDPRRGANLAALPYWLGALRAHPASARQLLLDFLDLRAVLAVEILERNALRLGGDEGQEVRSAVDALDALVQAGADLEAIIEADLEIARRLLELGPQIAFSTLWNSLASLLELVPEVAKAMYHDPKANVLGWRFVLERATSGEELRSSVLPLLRALDLQTADRFSEVLSR